MALSYYTLVTHTLPMNAEMTHATSPASQWKMAALMAFGGVVLSLGFPNDLLPGAWGDRPYPLIAWLALLPLFWGMLTLPARAARWGVWLFGLAFMLIHLFWMRLFGILPWLLSATYVSVYPLLAFRVAEWAPWGRAGRVVGFALAFTALEWLRGLGVFGFPWGELGMSQVDGPLAAITAIGGLPLLTGLMLLTTGAIALRLLEPTQRRLMIIAVVALLGCFTAGFMQTMQASARQVGLGNARPLSVSVVQPSTQRGLMAADLVTDRDWPTEQQRRLDVLIPLSAAAEREADVTHLTIWPESALPFEPPHFYYERVLRYSRNSRSYLLFGAPRFTVVGKQYRQRNAAYLLSPDGAIADEYAKMHLVPFGEFVPFVRPLISRFYSVRDNDIVPGTGHRLLKLDGHALGVSICFESTFSGIARAYADRGAHLLVYMTNDAWFHRGAAVRQHFNQARFRAIETGLPVARCASTGISGFIAPDGRVLAEIPTYARGQRTAVIFDGQPGTVYTHGGWLFGPLCALGAALLALAGFVAVRRWHDSDKAMS